MTPEQARVGRGVVYRARPEARPEDGQITSVHALDRGIVHVLYRGDGTAKATRLVDLTVTAPDIEQMAANHADAQFGLGGWNDAPAIIRNDIRERVQRARNDTPEGS